MAVFTDEALETEFINRTKDYRTKMENLYPDSFDWSMDCMMTREMVQMEILAEQVMRELAAEGVKDNEKKVRTLKVLITSLQQYRNDLLFSHKRRIKYRPGGEKEEESDEIGIFADEDWKE